MSLIAAAKARIDKYHAEDKVYPDDEGSECAFFKLSDDVGVKYYWHRSTLPRIERYVEIQDTLAREGVAPRVLSHVIEYAKGWFYLTEACVETHVFPDYDVLEERQAHFKRCIPEPPTHIQTAENLAKPTWEREQNPEWVEWYHWRQEYAREECRSFQLQNDLRDLLEVLRLEGVIENVGDFDERNWGVLADGTAVLIDMGCTQPWALESRLRAEEWRIENGYELV